MLFSQIFGTIFTGNFNSFRQFYNSKILDYICIPVFNWCATDPNQSILKNTNTNALQNLIDSFKDANNNQ